MAGMVTVWLEVEDACRLRARCVELEARARRLDDAEGVRLFAELRAELEAGLEAELELPQPRQVPPSSGPASGSAAAAAG